MTFDRQKTIDALNEKLSDKTKIFGCRMLNNETGMENIFLRANEANPYYSVTNQFGGTGFYHKEVFKIIGHPVTLARVLSEIKEFPLIQVGLYDGGFFFFQQFDEKKQKLCSWNLKNDTLEAQSDDCLLFLEKIFIKNT